MIINSKNFPLFFGKSRQLHHCLAVSTNRRFVRSRTGGRRLVAFRAGLHEDGEEDGNGNVDD